MGSSTGAALPSVTVTVIGSLSVSEPSLTTTSNVYAAGPCPSVGVQVNTPVLGSIAAPTGAPTRLNVSTCAGRSASVADAVKVNSVNSITERLPIAPSSGAALASMTVTVMVSVSLRLPSLTTTSNVYVPGPCASVGVQVNTPVLASIAAPAGAPARLNVSVFAGRSASVAVAVNVSSVCSSAVRSPIAL